MPSPSTHSHETIPNPNTHLLNCENVNGYPNRAPTINKYYFYIIFSFYLISRDFTSPTHSLSPNHIQPTHQNPENPHMSYYDEDSDSDDADSYYPRHRKPHYLNRAKSIRCTPDPTPSEPDCHNKDNDKTNDNGDELEGLFEDDERDAHRALEDETNGMYMQERPEPREFECEPEHNGNDEVNRYAHTGHHPLPMSKTAIENEAHRVYEHERLEPKNDEA